MAAVAPALAVCGDGVVDGVEQCDLGAGNGAADTCCTTLCEFRAVGLTCRPTAGPCDVLETCTGGSDTCPADAFQPATFQCRPEAGGCDVAELCTGTGSACPADEFRPAGTVCRAPVGSCDVTEDCDGLGPNCPADVFVPGGTVCRPATGECDVTEECTGTDGACPADALQPNGFECRPGTGECDPAETCDGVDVNCPEDAFAPDDTPCDDSSACTDEDVCFRGVCVGTQDLDVCLDDFQCYKVKNTPGTQRLTPISGVNLVDQFETTDVDATRTRHLCTPTDKNGEGTVDTVTHLKRYFIRALPGSPRHTPQTNIRVRNQLGELRVDTIRAEFLLVPANKGLLSPPAPPVPSAHNVDHYKCYKIRITAGTPRFPERVFVTVADQFVGTPRTARVKKPRRLCTPVEKNGEEVKNPTGHFMCYQIVVRPKHPRQRGVYVADQFGVEQVDTVKEQELCIPSEKQL
jgi:hypothetical protein